MGVVFMALNNLTFFVFWWALMRHVTTLRGWRLGDIQVLFGVVAAAFGLTVAVAGGVRHLGRFIDEGDLDTLLTQRKSVLVHALGLRSQPSGFGDLISGVIFIAWSGQVSWHMLPFVVAAIVASALVFVACGIVFFSLAFWLGKVDTVARQLWELLITFHVTANSVPAPPRPCSKACPRAGGFARTAGSSRFPPLTRSKPPLYRKSVGHRGHHSLGRRRHRVLLHRDSQHRSLRRRAGKTDRENEDARLHALARGAGAGAGIHESADREAGERPDRRAARTRRGLSLR